MAKIEHVRALQHLASWQDFRGMNPFGIADSGHALDRVNQLLGNATCILTVLAAAAEDSSALISASKSSEFDNRHGSVLAGALEGVADLVNLAAFMVEGPDA